MNDRPYVSSSMLSVALGRLFRTAMSGTCDTRPELVSAPLDLEIELPVVSVRGGTEVLEALFEPLGYEVESVPIPLDAQYPAWGASRCLSVRLRGRHTVRSTLEHLYVLLGVLDDRKHYWIGPDEIDKLLRRGSDWLGSHPQADLITNRYLRFGSFAREALARLSDAGEDTDLTDERNDDAEQAVERPISLNEQRLEAVTEAVRRVGGGRVVDLGCGEGRLLQRLVAERCVTEVLGVDVSVGALERAERRLRLDEMSERRREQVSLVQGALTYTDERLRGFDVATVVEVIEHLDSERLDAFADVVFAHAAPGVVRADDTQPGIQRQLRTPRRDFSEARRPSLRMDPRRVLNVGRQHQRPIRLQLRDQRHRPRRPSPRPADTDGGVPAMRETLTNIEIPELGLVVLCGASGSGKSTFARRHFSSTEIVSSDQCRALVGDDESDQSITGAAFELLRTIIDKRLEIGRLSVVDATNIKPEDRKPLLELARRWDVLSTAIVFDLPLAVCVEHNNSRQDRQTPRHAIKRQHGALRRTAKRLRKETLQPGVHPRLGF